MRESRVKCWQLPFAGAQIQIFWKALTWLAFLLIPQPSVAVEPLPDSEAAWYIADSVAVHPPLRGLGPKRSDVVFSTRTKRDNSILSARNFGATRVEWTYVHAKDESFLLDLKKSIGWAGGAMSITVQTPNNEGAAQDFDGNNLIAPWMRPWGNVAIWHTTTSPYTRKTLFDWAASYIRRGADSIQFDDSLMQLYSVEWGGDFSPTSLAGFREFLKSYPDKRRLAFLGDIDLNGFDYKEYLRKVHHIQNNAEYLRRYQQLPTTSLWIEYLTETVSSFFRDFRQHLDITAGRRFPLSMNLDLLNRPSAANRLWVQTEYVDYVIAETPINNVAEMYARAATMRSLGLGYVPSSAPDSVAEGRRAISTFYALGANPLVPWDVYARNGADGQPVRYFGKVEEFGDMYQFVRQNPQLFDGWESAPVVGIIIPIDKYREAETMALVRKLVSSQVPFAFVLTGGSNSRFELVRQQVEHFKVLMTVNPSSDISEKDIDFLRSIEIPKLDAQITTDDAIRVFSPFFMTGSTTDNVKLIPRGQVARGERSNELLIHVLAEPQDDSVDGLPCSRSFGIKLSALAGRLPRQVTWHGLNDQPRDASWNKVEQGIRIELPACAEWGVVHIELVN